MTVYNVSCYIVQKDGQKHIRLNIIANDTETATEKFMKHIKEKYNLKKKDIKAIICYPVVLIDLI